MSIESVMPSHHLILCHPLLLLPSNFPSFRVFSSELAFCINWPKYWSFSFSISPSNEYLGLISLRIDWLDLFAVQRTQESSPTPQFESMNSSVLSLLYGALNWKISGLPSRRKEEYQLVSLTVLLLAMEFRSTIQPILGRSLKKNTPKPIKTYAKLERTIEHTPRYLSLTFNGSQCMGSISEDGSVSITWMQSVWDLRRLNNSWDLGGPGIRSKP